VILIKVLRLLFVFYYCIRRKGKKESEGKVWILKRAKKKEKKKGRERVAIRDNSE
jgi:hypothetical protein